MGLKIVYVTSNLSEMKGGPLLFYNFARKVASRKIGEVLLTNIEDKKIDATTLKNLVPPHDGLLKLLFCTVPSKPQLVSLVEDFLIQGALSWKFIPLEMLVRSPTQEKWPLSSTLCLLKKLALKFDVIHIPCWRSLLSLAANIVKFQNKKKFQAKLVCHLFYHPFEIEYGYLKPLGMNKMIEPFWKTISERALIKSLAGFEAVTVSTPYEYSFLRQIGFEKAVFVGEGIDLNFIAALNPTILKITKETRKAWDGEHIILYLGSKSRGKGYPHVIQAFSELINLFPDIRLVVIGRNLPYSQDELIKKTLVTERRLNRKGLLFNYNWVSEAQKYAIINVSDLLVLPSMFETVPLVFLEAWAFKKPTIGCKIPTLNSVTGSNAALLVEYGNINQIKNAIIRILSDRKLSNRLGNAGYDRLTKTYNLDSVGEKLIKLYKSLV